MDSKIDNSRGQAQVTTGGRNPYSSPKLQQFGSVRALTQSGTMGQMETASMMGPDFAVMA